MHASGPPSAWVQRYSALIRPAGRVIDVACGSGRNALWLSASGFAVTGLDRDAAALAGLARQDGRIHTVQADIEGAAWPLPGQRYDAVVVTNYLWRPLWPQLLDSLSPDGGVLIYETFADGQQSIGKPSRPDFLLQPGELLQRCAGLRVVAFEDGFESTPGRYVQRVAALHPAKPAAAGGAGDLPAVLAPALPPVFPRYPVGGKPG